VAAAVGVADVEVRGTTAVVQAAVRTGDGGGGDDLRGGVRDDAGANHCGTQVRDNIDDGLYRLVAAGAGWRGGGHGRPWPAHCIPLRRLFKSGSQWRGPRGSGVCWWRRGSDKAVLGLFWWRCCGGGGERASA
jgi:hypothetical protein